MLKTIFKILLVLIILVALSLGVFWFFDRQNNGAGSPVTMSNIHIGNFFPFGQGSDTPGITTPTSGGTDTVATSSAATNVPVATPRLWQISSQPQSGAIAFTASGTPMVRYVDKATGNVFEGSLRVTGMKRITNTTIPKVYEATWQPSGKAVVMRFLADDKETVRSMFGRLTATASSTTPGDGSLQEMSTTFLSDRITSLAINNSTSTTGTGALAYVSKNQNGSMVYVTDSMAANPKQIFDSAINDWTVSWVNNTTLGLLAKPSGGAMGQFYFLKTDSGRLEKVLSGQPGLMASANQSGTKIMYSWATGNSFQSSLFNIKTGEQTALHFNTLADKCVWATKSSFIYCATPKTVPSGLYPDSWYQGRVSFDDTIWRMNTATGAAEFVIDPKIVANTEIDATNLTLDPEENYLIFTNKKDSQLWGLKI